MPAEQRQLFTATRRVISGSFLAAPQLPMWYGINIIALSSFIAHHVELSRVYHPC